jgi:exonuclease SbcD
MDFTQINEKLQQILIGIINDMAEKVDPSLPAVLAAHVWVLNARVGSEKGMSIGQEHMLLLSSVANPAFDYIALGHIHKAQVLNENPPTVYSGSLERLDFGDEDDQKGFYLVDIDTSGNGGAGVSGCRKVDYQFRSIEARRFYTLDIELEENDPDPTSTVLREIDVNRDKIKDAIVRVEIKLPAALSGKLRDTEIRNKIKDAYYLTIAREVIRETRLRLGKGALEGITPLEALKVYLESNYDAERAQILLEYGEKLIQENARKEQKP